MTRVDINAPSRPYSAYIEPGLLTRAGATLREVLPNQSRYFALTVAPVRKHWGDALAASFAAAGLSAEFIEMPDGERYKTLATVADLAGKLVRRGVDRKSVLLAWGGGGVAALPGSLAPLNVRAIAVTNIPPPLRPRGNPPRGAKPGGNI